MKQWSSIGQLCYALALPADVACPSDHPTISGGYKASKVSQEFVNDLTSSTGELVLLSHLHPTASAPTHRVIRTKGQQQRITRVQLLHWERTLPNNPQITAGHNPVYSTFSVLAAQVCKQGAVVSYLGLPLRLVLPANSIPPLLDTS